MNIGQEGLPITIYARGWKTRIAEVTLVGRSSTVGLTRHVRVKLDLTCKEKIYAPGTFVHVIEGDNTLGQKPLFGAVS